MCRTWGGEVNSEMCLKFTEHRVEANSELWLICAEHGWNDKQRTVSDMYRIWGGEVNSELCLICTENGVER